MKDLLSLVIPTFQRPSYLKRKLFHLKLQSCNFKILILDTSAGRFLNQNKNQNKKLLNFILANLILIITSLVQITLTFQKRSIMH